MVTEIDNLEKSLSKVSIKDTSKQAKIESIAAHIAEIKNDKIFLLRNKEVIQWIYGDLSFLKLNDTEKSETKRKELDKKMEDEWGRKMMKTRRPDKKLDKQWTNLFGEYISEEIYILHGKNPKKPDKKTRFQPDLEIDNYIIEVKTQTYKTTGTVGEKILGVPFKYADVPILYGKSLKIICIGGAEKECKEKHYNLNYDKASQAQKLCLDFYKEKLKIEYISAISLLEHIISN
jgi:hypothetical protein